MKMPSIASSARKGVSCLTNLPVAHQASLPESTQIRLTQVDVAHCCSWSKSRKYSRGNAAATLLDDEAARQARLDAGIDVDDLSASSGQSSGTVELACQALTDTPSRKRGPQDSGKGVRLMVWPAVAQQALWSAWSHPDVDCLKQNSAAPASICKRHNAQSFAGWESVRLQVWSHVPLVPPEDTGGVSDVHGAGLWCPPHAHLFLQELPHEPTRRRLASGSRLRHMGVPTLPQVLRPGLHPLLQLRAVPVRSTFAPPASSNSRGTPDGNEWVHQCGTCHAERRRAWSRQDR